MLGCRPPESRSTRCSPLAGAIARGELGLEAAAHVVRNLAAASDRCSVDDLGAAERALVEEAAVLGPDLVADQARVWRDHLDPDGSEPRCERQHRERRFTIGRERDDGMTPYSGLADPVSAGILRAAIRARRPMPRMLDTDDAEAVMTDERSFEQRDFDSFMGLITAGTRAGDSFSRGGRASVVATVPLAELRNGVGVGWLDDVRESIAVGAIDELACDAGYEIVVTNDAGAIVSLTSPRRYFTRGQRRALAARDGGCVFPGCRAPAPWSDAHHVIEHENGGPTDVSNGALLYPERHHYIHSGRYRLKMVRGRPHLLAPPHLDPDQRWRPVGKSRLEKQQALRASHDHGRNRPMIR